MKRVLIAMLLLGIAFFFIKCTEDAFMEEPQMDQTAVDFRKGRPSAEVGNNLSFPVIWSGGTTGVSVTEGSVTPTLNGTWWYWWGMEDEQTPLSRPPDPDDPLLRYADNYIPGTVDEDLLAATLGATKAYLQKSMGNTWQAEAGWQDGENSYATVDAIDWGDNLESVDWYTRSKVRTEVVLFKTVTAMLTYGMLHTSGWGIDEVWGLEKSLDGVVNSWDGTEATVFSPNAQLTIQKLLVPRGSASLEGLVWDAALGYWTGENLIDEPLLGPEGYSAEINVKGRIIFGYTWDVNRLNDGPGDYRITFSFGVNDLTDISSASIVVPAEEELIAAADAISPAEADDSGGAEAKVSSEYNVTYIDIHINERSGGGKGGNGGNGGNGGPW